MNMYVKFCGGCNPRYDRSAFYRHLQEDFPQVEFHTDTNRAASSDLILIFEGCERACAAFSDELAQRECFCIFSVNDYEPLHQKIEHMIKKQI